jgi:iron complex transport system substrate-binding protein
MKKTIFSVIIFCLIVGCSNSTLLGTPELSIQDALGRTISFTKLPERIVIAGKQTPTISNFLYLFPSEINKVVAIENRSQAKDNFLSLIDAEYDSKLVLEKGAGVEQIAPIDPDLVILATSMKENIGNGLEEVGIKVIYVSFENNEEIYHAIEIFGTVFDSEARAKWLISEYEKINSEINGKLAENTKKEKVLLIQVATIDNGYSFKVPSADWLQTKMIEDLEATPVWKSETLSGGWVEVNIEQIINWKPENIFVINYQGHSLKIVDKLLENDIWNVFIEGNDIKLKAFPYDFTSWDQPDTRWILGYSWIAHILYPEEIHKADVVGIVDNFYKHFYNLEESVISENILPVISTFF